MVVPLNSPQSIMVQNSIRCEYDGNLKRANRPPTKPKRLNSNEFQKVEKQNEAHSTSTVYFSPSKTPKPNRFRQYDSPVLQMRDCIRRKQQLNQLQCSRLQNNVGMALLDKIDDVRMTPTIAVDQCDQAGEINDVDDTCIPLVESVPCDDSIPSFRSWNPPGYKLSEHNNPRNLVMPKRSFEEGKTDDDFSFAIDFEADVNNFQEYEYRHSRFPLPRGRSAMSFSRVSSMSSITWADDIEDYDYGYATASPQIVSPSARRMMTPDFFGKQTPTGGGMAPKAPRRRSTLHHYFPDDNAEQGQKTASLSPRLVSPSPRLISPSPRLVSPSPRRMSTLDIQRTPTTGGGMAPKAPRRRSTLHFYFPDIEENVEQERKSSD